MCGICGIYNFTGAPVEQQLIEAMSKMKMAALKNCEATQMWTSFSRKFGPPSHHALIHLLSRTSYRNYKYFQNKNTDLDNGRTQSECDVFYTDTVVSLGGVYKF